MAWHDVCASSDVVTARPYLVEVRGREVGLLRAGKRVYAVLNWCGHAGAPLAFGRIAPGFRCEGPGQPVEVDHDRPQLMCPWHHWGFDLTSGECTAPVRRPRMKTYPAQELNGRVLLDY